MASTQSEYIKKIDKVLPLLNNHSGYFETQEKFKNELDKNQDAVRINDKELNRILLKLTEEKYIEMKYTTKVLPDGQKIPLNTMTFAITFDGLLLLEQYGSYSNFLKVKNQDASFKKTVERFVLIASIAAIILTLIELIRFILEVK